MWRICGFVLGAGVFLAALPGQAFSFSQAVDALGNDGRQQSLIVQVRPLTEKQKCQALNRCRRKYTICYNKLERARKNIEKHKIECVKPYQKCINASFSGLDFFFTRWFNPNVLDCRKYSG